MRRNNGEGNASVFRESARVHEIQADSVDYRIESAGSSARYEQVARLSEIASESERDRVNRTRAAIGENRSSDCSHSTGENKRRTYLVPAAIESADNVDGA